MEEGELVRLKAEAAIRSEEEKQKQIRAKNMQNREDILQINEKNKELKAREEEKMREEERKIE